MAKLDSPKCPFILKTSELVLVKPSKPTPEVTLTFSTIDNDPFMETFVRTLCVFSPKPNPQDPFNNHQAFLFQNALSLALVYYYPLAGKLHRRSDDKRLELNYTAEDGVPFIRATAACTLSSVNYLEGVDQLDATKLLVPSDPVKDEKSRSGYNPIAIQMTNFACGGITIGVVHSHSVFDGIGVAQLFRTITELAYGKAKPTVVPVWDRHRLTFNNMNGMQSGELGDDINDQDPKLDDLVKACSSAATSPYAPTDDMVRDILNISAEDITRLKTTISNDNQDQKNMTAVTTLEILAAHVWRARCRALKLSPNGTTHLHIAVNIRGIIDPPLPEGYYGNACVGTTLTLTAKELSESPLSRVVRLIKDVKKTAMKKEYVLEKLEEIERRLKQNAAFGNMNEAFMAITDWRNIGLHYDIWGGFVNMIPLTSMRFSSICIFLPAAKAVPGMQGGVRVLVTLPRAAIVKFKEEMKTFDK